MENTIYINQIGYELKALKYAFVENYDSTPKEFSICRQSDEKLVFSSILKESVYDDISGKSTSIADFSDFSEPGIYKIVCGVQESLYFQIGTNLFKDLYCSSLEYFTNSRCGKRQKVSIWAPEDCHTSTARIFGSEEQKQVIGGWHDAGDYGRYVVAGAKTIMDLLLCYQNVPNNKDFDILDEVRFELEWMLQMQRDDGAVYHKISCYNFCSFIMPHSEKNEQVLAPISTAATADFIGTLSFASTIFAKKDKEFADLLLEKALLAQKYLDSHNDVLYENPKEITTGSYADKEVNDEKFFALISLFVATQNEEFLHKALKLFNDDWSVNYFWGMVSGYGIELLLQNKELVKDKSIINKFTKILQKKADELLENVKKSSFRVSITKVFWGSNGCVCDNAHTLLLAYKIINKKEYYEAAKNQLDYILGCNPLNICYVSGFGTRAMKYPHHRPSGFLKKTMPGMLSGGPSSGLQDEVARKNLTGKAPLCCFIDDVGSYSTNEVAIYWNSPMVLLMAMLGFVQ